MFISIYLPAFFLHAAAVKVTRFAMWQARIPTRRPANNEMNAPAELIQSALAGAVPLVPSRIVLLQMCSNLLLGLVLSIGVAPR